MHIHRFCFLSNSRPLILKTLERSTVQEALDGIIETFYNAKLILNFAVRNNRLDPDFEISN